MVSAVVLDYMRRTIVAWVDGVFDIVAGHIVQFSTDGPSPPKYFRAQLYHYHFTSFNSTRPL